MLYLACMREFTSSNDSALSCIEKLADALCSVCVCVGGGGGRCVHVWVCVEGVHM